MSARLGPPPVHNRFLAVARAGSDRLNRIVSRRLGRTLKIQLNSEYPKAGGSWFGKMAAEIMQVPCPEHSIFPVGCACVLHNHWPWRRGYDRAWYLRRDGRDSMVSFYFHRMREMEAGNPVALRRFGPLYDRILGRGFDPQDSRGNMRAFIEGEFAQPMDARQNWRDHVMSWHDGGRGRPGVMYLSYEELLEDPRSVLRAAVEHATGAPPDDWVVDLTVEKYSMARQTGGRAKGEEDRSSFIRKGVAGDWVNHFDRDAARTFDRLAGDALVALGYEADRDWVDRYELP